jgi:hypothetical protein
MVKVCRGSHTPHDSIRCIAADVFVFVRHFEVIVV